MKIGILTQPLYTNYGGLLQAWALQKILVEMGHSVVIINRVKGSSNLPLWRKIGGKIKYELLILLGKQKRYVRVTQELKKLAEINVIPFRQNRYRGISPELRSNDEFLNYINKNTFDAFIVGSDQVWRPKYSPHLMTYFLDFLRDNNSIKKITYAASFGVDKWEFSKKETREARDLLRLFDLVTVRESSGIDFVKHYFGRDAIHVLDPTLLLSKDDYIELINNPSIRLHSTAGNLYCYVLDKSEEVRNVINDCSNITGLIPYYCNYITPVSKLENINQKEESVVPPVEQWLKSFYDAKMIVTDSFHGVAFSIIFNKPFWVIANESRGIARILSILKQFGLEDRLISDKKLVDWDKKIDWNKINMRRKDLSDFSIKVLTKSL